MAVRRFELDTIPADIQARNLTGYQLTDLGFAVNKFDAASTTPVLVTDNVATTLGTVTGITVTDATRTITFASNAIASLQSLGVVHVVGWTVIIDGGSVQARAAGTHINFWNCNMAVTGTNATGSNWTLGSTVAAGTGGSAVGQRAYQTAGTNPGAASSVNLYGCSLGISHYNAWYQVSDAIDTTVTFASSLNATNSTRWNTCQGGRWLRCTVKNGAAAGIASYGGHTFQNVIPDKLAFAVGNDGAGIPRTVLIDRPEWQDPFQTQYIVMNSPNDAELRCYVYGGPFFGDSVATTLDNTATGANFGVTDAAVASDAITARWAQGVMQFDVIAPTYLDAVTREPVQGVVVRARTNALPNGLLGTGTAFDTYSERVNTESANTRFGNNFICINEAITGANGRLQSSQYLTSTNGGANFTTANGYLDFLDWSDNATVGSTSFGTGANDDAAVADIISPEGVLILPRMRTYLDVISGTNQATVGAYTNSQERRSYAYDVDLSGDIEQPDFRAPVYVDDGEITVESLIGTRIKSTNVGADNLPDISFDGSQTASLQDFGNIARAAWASYSFDPVFDGDDERPSDGPFDERTYPIRVRVNGTPQGSADFYQTEGVGVQFNSGQLRISVDCAGVAPDLTNDVAGNDPFTTSFNNGNQPLDLGGQLLETIGGCTNLRTLTNGEINNTGTGAILFQQTNNGAAAANLENRVTGVVVLNNTGAGGIDNLPPFLGRTTGEDTITIENSVAQSAGADRTVGTVTYSSPSGNGLYSPSTWTGVTTLSAFDYGEVRTITFNAGCNLEGTVSIQASEDSRWTFSSVLDTLDLNIPATQTSLVRIDTGVDDQNTDLDRYNQVRAWLVSKLGETGGVIPGVSEERTAANGGTEPSTGYWLVRPPALAPTMTTYQVPANLRNGVFAVKNIVGDAVTARTPVVVNTADGQEATYSITVSSAAFETGDHVRIYWRPDATETNAYNTTFVDITAAPTADVTLDLVPNEVPSVLWGDIFEANIEDAVGTATMNMIEGGTNPAFDGTVRSELQFVNAAGILDDPSNGATRTLYVGMTALNADPDYLLRLYNNDDLTTDYISSSGSELLVNGDFCYLNTGTTDVQQVITSVTNTSPRVPSDTSLTQTGGTTAAQFTPLPILSGAAQAIIILPNPAGATPGQIAAAVGSGLGTVTSRLDNGRAAFNANPILTAPGQEWAE